MLAVAHIYIRSNIHNMAVNLFRKPQIAAAVSGFHVKYRNMKAFGRDGCQTAVGVSQYQNRIGIQFHHKVIGFGDNVSYGVSQVFSYGGEIVVRLAKAQAFNEKVVKFFIIILSGMTEVLVKIHITELDHLRETDDLRSCSYDSQKL